MGFLECALRWAAESTLDSTTVYLPFGWCETIFGLPPSSMFRLPLLRIVGRHHNQQVFLAISNAEA